MIENGSTVTWGTKTGVVVAFIPAGGIPSKVYPDLNHEASSRDRLGYGFHGSSKNDRYLVRVDRFHATTGRQISSWWYGPTKQSIDARNSGLFVDGAVE
jgi:hypothetical protein